SAAYSDSFPREQQNGNSHGTSRAEGRVLAIFLETGHYLRMYWVAYRGRDTNYETKLFSGTTEAAAERMQTLLQGPAESQDGEVSEIFEAKTQDEALKSATSMFLAGQVKRLPKWSIKNVDDIIHLLVEMTGDQAIGGPVSPSANKPNQLVFEGLRGSYILVQGPTFGIRVDFFPGSEPIKLRQPVGFYYTRPQSWDTWAANIITHLLKNVSTLHFQHGYASSDPHLFRLSSFRSEGHSVHLESDRTD